MRVKRRTFSSPTPKKLLSSRCPTEDASPPPSHPPEDFFSDRSSSYPLPYPLGASSSYRLYPLGASSSYRLYPLGMSSSYRLSDFLSSPPMTSPRMSPNFPPSPPPDELDCLLLPPPLKMSSKMPPPPDFFGSSLPPRMSPSTSPNPPPELREDLPELLSLLRMSRAVFFQSERSGNCEIKKLSQIPC
jgi:hypothetical protein